MGEVPGASPPPAAPTPARSTPYRTIPEAGPAINAATTGALVPGAEADKAAPVSRGGIHYRRCTWTAAGRYGRRILTVMLTVVTDQAGVYGQGAVSAAGDRFQTVAGDQSEYGSGDVRLLRGLGDRAHLSSTAGGVFRLASLHIRTRNVIITVAYAGSDADGHPAGEAIAANGAITAARAVLTALAAQ
jgi:hypothetical protein